MELGVAMADIQIQLNYLCCSGTKAFLSAEWTTPPFLFLLSYSLLLPKESVTCRLMPPGKLRYPSDKVSVPICSRKVFIYSLYLAPTLYGPKAAYVAIHSSFFPSQKLCEVN